MNKCSVQSRATIRRSWDDYDEDELPGDWAYAVGPDEEVAVVVWACPVPENMNKSVAEVRPGLNTAGFDRTTLVDGTTVDKRSARMVALEVVSSRALEAAGAWPRPFVSWVFDSAMWHATDTISKSVRRPISAVQGELEAGLEISGRSIGRPVDVLETQYKGGVVAT